MVVTTVGTIPDGADFDYPAGPLAALAECPVLVVRAVGGYSQSRL
jgi:hypothetical protein